MAAPRTSPAFDPVVLTGRVVELQPLAPSHVDGMVEAYEPGTMDLFSHTADVLEPIDRAHGKRYVQEALDGQARGEYLPFAVIERSTGRVIGSTRFGGIDVAVPCVEIGWTWYAPGARGTEVNPECKLLLLTHAFDTLGCRVVSLKTSAYNERSQRAIARLGALRDGVLRRDRVQRDGRVRDTVVFSILAEEWPSVRRRLERRLAGEELEHDEPPVVIRRAVIEDAPALLDYAVRNREFLAPFEPLRGEDRFTLEAMRAQLQPQSGERIQYLACSEGGLVVGQAALSNVLRAPVFRSATIGYSVDEQSQGRGIASSLVRHAVREALHDLGLHRVEAGTLLDNRASQRVLERCGFTRIGVAPRHVRIAGRWQDHMLYVITAEDLE